MKKELLNQTIYQVYVRNYTKAGTFKGLIKKLDYIKDLGVDIIYLLPIHEIGVKAKKGTLGCPYSIQDYYSIAKELGTLEDFKKLIKEIHARDMKIMMDIVFNHSSRDSVLLNDHQDWYWHDKNGNLGTKVGDWSDVYDLNHDNLELEEYLANNVKYWSDLGVDGFRFDVAALIPMSFFRILRNKIGSKPILLAESADPDFVKYLRLINAVNVTDAELYECFDIEYNYDIFRFLRMFFEKPCYVTKFAVEDALHNQMSYLPTDGMKINCLENHDINRIASYFKGNALKNITALSFFIKGTAFVYGGQEVKATHRPSLFEKETIPMKVKDVEFHNFIKDCIAFKSSDFNKEIIDSFVIKNKNKLVFTIENVYPTFKLFGIFNVSNKPEIIESERLENGQYIDLLTNKIVEVADHKIEVFEPLILRKM